MSLGGSRGPFYSSFTASCALVYADPTLETERIYIDPLRAVPRRVEVSCSCCMASATEFLADLDHSHPVLGGLFLLGEEEKSADEHVHGATQKTSGGLVLGALDSPFYLFHRSGRPKLYTMIHHPEMPSSLLPVLRTPSARSGHVFVAVEDFMVLHGGLGEDTLQDTWWFYPNERRWEKMNFPGIAEADLPSAAYGQASTVVTASHCGCSGRRAASPSSRQSEGETLPHQHLLIVGGCTMEALIDESWILCPQQPAWQRVRFSARLPPLWGAAAATMRQPRLLQCPGVGQEEEEEVVVLFGGMLDDRLVTTMYILHMERVLTQDDVERLKSIILVGTASSPNDLSDHLLEQAVGSYLVETLHLPYTYANLSFETFLTPESTLGVEATTENSSERSSPPPPYQEGEARVEPPEVQPPPPLPQLPSPRRRPCSCVYEHHTLIVFGGRDFQSFFNDVWEWDILTRTWRELHRGEGKSPVARTGACMALDAERKLLLMFGGYREEGHMMVRVLDDLHIYHLEGNYWERVIINEDRNWDPCMDYHQRATPSHEDESAAEEVLNYSPVVLDDHMDRLINLGKSPVRSSVPFSTDEPTLVVRSVSRLFTPSSSYYNVSPSCHFPIVRPYHRTMASLTQDPLHPRRFFLFGGRLINEPRSDLLEITFEAKSNHQESYRNLSRASSVDVRESLHNQLQLDYLEKLIEKKHPFYHNVSLSSRGLRASIIDYLKDKGME